MGYMIIEYNGTDSETVYVPETVEQAIEDNIAEEHVRSAGVYWAYRYSLTRQSVCTGL